MSHAIKARVIRQNSTSFNLTCLSMYIYIYAQIQSYIDGIYALGIFNQSTDWAIQRKHEVGAIHGQILNSRGFNTIVSNLDLIMSGSSYLHSR